MARAVSPARRAQLDEKKARKESLILAGEEPEPNRPLNERERLYVKCRAEGMAHTPALVAAGMYNNSVTQAAMESRPTVREALRVERELYAQAAQLTRKQVMDGFLAAVEQAKLQADPTAQIAGWRELAKMCGYYAPEVKRLELTTDAKRALQKFEAMSDDELLMLVDADVIEGEAHEIPDA